jgi:RNA-binding protein
MKNPRELTGKQRSQLRALAHPLHPLVQIGKDGLSDGVFDAVDVALRDHELIKVKFTQNAEVDRKDAAVRLAEGLDAHVVGTIGSVLILYRRHPETPVVPLHT